MTDSYRGGHDDSYSKRWPSEFSTDQSVEDCTPYLELRKRTDCEGDEDIWGFLLQATEESGPSCLDEEVKDWCEGKLIRDFEAEARKERQRRAAWLDDRGSSHLRNDKALRKYPNPLSAATLYGLLKAPRFTVAIPTFAEQRHVVGQGSETGNAFNNYHNADRRLIYVLNLDPDFIQVLLQTATSRQIGVIRDAFRKHLAFQVSMRAKIPAKRKLMFQIEFHLPYFALRREDPCKEAKHEPFHNWIDLSFLGLEMRKTRGYRLHQAHFTLVIYGLNNLRWVAYAFENNHHDERFEKDLEEEKENYSYDSFHEDPIASDGRNGVDANQPIHDPREYFLLVFEARTSRMLREWEYVIGHFQHSIDAFRKRHYFNQPREYDVKELRLQNAKTTHDQIQMTSAVLSQLRECLSSTIREWQRFNSKDGDGVYFADSASFLVTSQQNVCRLRHELKDTLDSLENMKSKLDLQCTTVQKWAKDFKLRLILDSNEATLASNQAMMQSNTSILKINRTMLSTNKAMQSNVLITEYMNAVFYPLTLTAALFSMQQVQSIFSFQLSRTSFCITFIVIMIFGQLFFIIFGKISHWWKGLPRNKWTLYLSTGSSHGMISDEEETTNQVITVSVV